MSEKNLFKNFQNVSTEEWLLQIEKDLKGKDFNSLLKKSKEGISIKPVYHQEAIPKSQGLRKERQWKIVQEMLVMDNKQANKEALIHLNKGATSLLFYLACPIDLETLLNQIQIQHISIHFVTEGNGMQVLNALKVLAQKRGLEEEEIAGSINIDCLENLSRTGNWFQSQEKDFEELKTLNQSTLRNLKSICVNANLFSHAGASQAQELGLALAMAYENIVQLELKESSSFWFNFGIGSDFFGEISKLRAFRRLWDQLQTELNLKPHQANIYAETSLRNKTILDAHNNLIRSTTEAMAAIIGGCDEFSVKPFNVAFDEPNDFSERISKNQQSILQHESHLEAVNDIAKGSHFIESYTEELAEKAWEFFKEIEKRGGYLEALKTNWIQDQVEAVADTEQEKFNKNEKILIGANKHRNKEDEIQEKIRFGLFYKEAKGEKTVRPLKVKRLSEELEK